jgi:excisionase family DNA binding protein
MSDLHKILAAAKEQAAAVAEEVHEREHSISEAMEAPVRASDVVPPSDLPKLLYTWQEASWVCGLHESSLRRLVKEGALRIVKIGGSTRLRRSDIDQLIADNLVESHG